MYRNYPPLPPTSEKRFMLFFFLPRPTASWLSSHPHLADAGTHREDTQHGGRRPPQGTKLSAFWLLRPQGSIEGRGAHHLASPAAAPARPQWMDLVAAQSGQSPHARGSGGKPHCGGGEESTIRVGARTRQRTAVQQFLKACCADFFCFCLLAVEDGRPTLVLSSISQPLIERRKGSGQLWALSPEMEVLPSWTPTLTWSVARYRACITRPSQAFAASTRADGVSIISCTHACAGNSDTCIPRSQQRLSHPPHPAWHIRPPSASPALQPGPGASSSSGESISIRSICYRQYFSVLKQIQCSVSIFVVASY
jgi:hypothetical protein